MSAETFIKSRQALCCPVFESPDLLSERTLPTYEDVMKHYLMRRHQLKTNK